MPTETFSAPSFTVQLKSENTCAVHFRNGQVCFGSYQLTPSQQAQFISQFSASYARVRARNHAWRFLSSVSDYFTGQLHELKGMSSDEGRIRYLFCHAERDETNKTTEALKAMLPAFYQSLPLAQAKAAQSDAAFFYRSRLISIKQTPAESFRQHTSQIEAVFSPLWRFPSIGKASYSFHDRWTENKRHRLFFAADCRARIVNKNNYFFSATDVEREVMEANCGKMLYESLEHFRTLISEPTITHLGIDNAFKELLSRVKQDDPGLNPVFEISDFYGAVNLMRHQLASIYSDWRKTLGENSVCELKR